MTDLEKYQKEAQKLGAREGALGRPLPDSQEPDANEVRYSVEAQRTYKRLTKTVDQDYEKISKQCAKLSGDLDSLILQAESFEQDFNFGPLVRSKLESIRTSTVEQIIRLRFAEASVREFKEIHGLIRNADYHKNGHEYWSIVVLLFALEGLVNAFFYSVGGDYISGLLIAFGVSASLLAVGCLIGWQFRYTNASQLHLKIFGWMALPETILLVSLCSGVAAYRVLLEKKADLIREGATNTSGVEFAGAFISGMKDWTVPFKGDLLSILAFVLAVCVSLFFIYKGYKFLDPVPGYDRLERAAEQEHNNYSSLMKLAKDSVREVAEAESQTRKLWLKDAESLASSVAQLLPQINIVSEQYNNHVRSVIHDFIAIIKIYRAANQNVAPTTRPTFFLEDPKLSLDNRATQLTDLKEGILSLKTKISAAREEYDNRIRDQLNQVNDQQGKMYSMIQEFGVDCEQEAKRNMSKTKSDRLQDENTLNNG